MPKKSEDASSGQLSDMLKELKNEMKSLREDMNRMEETVLKERLRQVEDSLSQTHLSVYAGQREEGLNQELALLLNPDCKNKAKCLEHCKETFEENTKVINRSSAKEAIADLDSRIAENQLMIEKTKDSPCENCFSNLQKKLTKEKRAYQEIVLVKDIESDGKTDDHTLNIPFLMQNLFEPLGNDSRLKILSSVYHGKKSFSELSKIVELKAGHLAFHLRKLVNANLIAQEAFKGDYVITQKGLTLVKEMFTLQK